MIITKKAKRDAKHLFRLCQTNGLMDEERVRHVTNRLVSAHYRECPAVLAHFLRLAKLDRAKHTAHIESAAPLAGDLKIALEGSLTRLYGDGLRVEYVDRPALLGGIRIQIGNDVYDGSIRARLAALEKSF
jgi:F-type H+-transporting ATPase subunit delta